MGSRRRASEPISSGLDARPVTAREVAERCGVELKTVHGWAERGIVPHFRTPGRHLRFRPSDVDALVARHGRAAPPRASTVLVLGAGPTAGAAEWQFVADPYEGLVRAATARPAVLVFVAEGLGGVEVKAFVRAIAGRLPEARLVWVGVRVPRGLGTRVERVASLPDAWARLAT